MLKTNFADDFDDWRVHDLNTGDTYIVKTNFSNDWDNWVVFLNGVEVLRMNTTFFDALNDWDVTYDEMTNSVHRACVIFIPIFISSVHQQGIF